MTKTELDPERFPFLETLELFWYKVLDNPLASIVTLLVLIGLPYTLFKAKESSTQANERLDRLMREMKDFKFEKPLIDLQDKFKDISFNNSPVTNYDQEMTDDFLAAGPMDLQRETDDETPELSLLAEENFDETEISQPVESSVEDEEYASHEIDDLQTRMEQTIKRLRLKYPSPEDTEAVASEETNTDSTPSFFPLRFLKRWKYRQMKKQKRMKMS